MGVSVGYELGLDAPPPLAGNAGGSPVFRRTWLLVPEWHGRRLVGPMLTGMFGFPWREAELDARCLQQDPAPGDFPFATGRIDRYHPVVPDPECSCGIYASRESDRARYLLAPSHPLVSGFVRLSGRLIRHKGEYRAQRASIVGPLTVCPPPAPRWLRRKSSVTQVVATRDRYVFGRSHSRKAMPLRLWRDEVGEALRIRYGADVIGLEAVPR